MDELAEIDQFANRERMPEDMGSFEWLRHEPDIYGSTDGEPIVWPQTTTSGPETTFTIHDLRKT